ncbi:MAG: hypothetical protein DRJ01_01965 [Bacteroidetes bacterium]|nr:MAG: hypothetical protein DRJ01_01965 [Bacteroidota bacterium]
MKRNFILILSLLICFNLTKAQKKPENKKIKFSFSERIRLSSFDNAISLNDSSDIYAFSRYKTNVGVKFIPNKNIELNLKLGNQAIIWLSPRSKKNTLSEVFIDQLYFKWKNVANLPLEITFGRQNIMLDEGFICLDGQPLTGSRSTYFNAIKSIYSFNDNNNITAFVSYIPRTDDLLPIINEDNPAQLLEEQANTGLGLYYKTNINKLKLSAYYFRKNTFSNDFDSTQTKINTLGARLLFPIIKNLELTTETAYQFGNTDEFNINSFGGYFHLDYNIDNKIPLINMLTIGGFYLSGDDPSSDKIEAWNPLWSRWPKWSESYIFTLIPENNCKVAYWSNMASLYAAINAKLSENIFFNATFNHLLALEDNLSAFCSGSGKTRGNLLKLKLNYKIDKNWSGHFIWENFAPGDFYPTSADGYNFFRFELLFKI